MLGKLSVPLQKCVFSCLCASSGWFWDLRPPLIRLLAAQWGSLKTQQRFKLRTRWRCFWCKAACSGGCGYTRVLLCACVCVCLFYRQIQSEKSKAFSSQMCLLQIMFITNHHQRGNRYLLDDKIGTTLLSGWWGRELCSSPTKGPISGIRSKLLSRPHPLSAPSCSTAAERGW